MKIARSILATTLLVIALPLSATAQQPVDSRHAVNSDSYVRIYMETGGEIRISGWSRDSVAFSGTADAGLPELEFGITKEGTAAKGGIWTDKKGKGAVEYWVAVVKPGRTLFEVANVTEEQAKEAFRLAGHKLPIKTKFVTRQP